MSQNSSGWGIFIHCRKKRQLSFWKPEIWAAGPNNHQIINTDQQALICKGHFVLGECRDHTWYHLKVRITVGLTFFFLFKWVWKFGGQVCYLLDEQVKLLSDLPAWITSYSRDALQVTASQAGNAAPGKRLLHLHRVKMSTRASNN